MKMTIESTSKIVTLQTEAGAVPARVWEGVTDGGVRLIAFVTRVAVKEGEDVREFERDLAAQRVPSAEAASFPLRLIL